MNNNIKVRLVNPKYYRSYKNVWRALEIARISHGIKGEHNLEVNRQLLRRIIQDQETSVLEHMNFTFHIRNITRGCLQEVVRHRHASYTVLSTRFTLKKIIKEGNKNIDKYFYCPNDQVRALTHMSLASMADKIKSKTNDDLKAFLTENMYTELYMTINLRSLLNFLDLRYSDKAYPEIKRLAFEIGRSLVNIHPLNTLIMDCLGYYSPNTYELKEALSVYEI